MRRITAAKLLFMCMFSTTKNKTTNDDQTVIIFRLFSVFGFGTADKCWLCDFQCSQRSKTLNIASRNCFRKPKFRHRLDLESNFKFRPSTDFHFRPWISIALHTPNIGKMLKYENPKIFYQFPVQTLRLNLIDYFYQFRLWFRWIWIWFEKL